MCSSPLGLTSSSPLGRRSGEACVCAEDLPPVISIVPSGSVVCEFCTSFASILRTPPECMSPTASCKGAFSLIAPSPACAPNIFKGDVSDLKDWPIAVRSNLGIFISALIGALPSASVILSAFVVLSPLPSFIAAALPPALLSFSASACFSVLARGGGSESVRRRPNARHVASACPFTHVSHALAP